MFLASRRSGFDSCWSKHSWFTVKTQEGFYWEKEVQRHELIHPDLINPLLSRIFSWRHQHCQMDFSGNVLLSHTGSGLADCTTCPGRGRLRHKEDWKLSGLREGFTFPRYPSFSPFQSPPAFVYQWFSENFSQDSLQPPKGSLQSLSLKESPFVNQ